MRRVAAHSLSTLSRFFISFHAYLKVSRILLKFQNLNVNCVNLTPGYKGQVSTNRSISKDHRITVLFGCKSLSTARNAYTIFESLEYLSYFERQLPACDRHTSLFFEKDGIFRLNVDYMSDFQS